MINLIAEARIERIIDKLLAQPMPDPGQAPHLVNIIKKRPELTIRRLVARIPLLAQIDQEKIQIYLRLLVSDQTLDVYWQLLSEVDLLSARVLLEVLKDCQDFDPNRLVSYLRDQKFPKSMIVEILLAQSEKLDAHLLIREFGQLDSLERNLICELLKNGVTESLIPELINRATAKDDQIRSCVAFLLGKTDSLKAIHVLRDLLKDPVKDVREAALSSLEDHLDYLDVATLFDLIRDPDIRIQYKAIDGIVRLKDPQTIDHLIVAIQDESEYVRRAAVEILNHVGTSKHIQALFSAIKDEDWWVRARAADALARIGGPTVIKAVVDLLKNKDEYLRRAAIEILNVIEDERAFVHLMGAIQDADWWVRERAIDALARMGNKAAVPALLPLIREESQTAIVTLRALAKLGSSSLLDYLEQALNRDEPALRIEAILTMTDLTDVDHWSWMKARLQPLTLESVDSEIREAAEDALSRLEERFASVYEEKDDLQTHGQAAGMSDLKAIKGVPILDENEFDINALRVGDVLGERFRYQRRVGRGAFGVVLLAEDLVRGEPVVLKFMHTRLSEDQNAVQRFQREHQFARKVNHPNVVRIYEFFKLGQHYVISMEYFPSTPLSADVRARKPLGMARSMHVVHEVAQGMAAAHAMGVIHRDLKPGNILVNESQDVKIVDFGVAVAVDGGDTRLTRTGLMVGTPRYMAPEQVLGKQTSERTDIYSLGVIFYELMTGRPPYKGDDNISVMYSHVQGGALPPQEINPQVSGTIGALVMRMMAVEPSQRFHSMIEVSETIENLMMV